MPQLEVLDKQAFFQNPSSDALIDKESGNYSGFRREFEGTAMEQISARHSLGVMCSTADP
jgi:hypothetical protein